MIGASEVGKTALVERYLYDEFDESYKPTMEKVQRKKLMVDGTELKLSIIDTGGMEDFAYENNW